MDIDKSKEDDETKDAKDNETGNNDEKDEEAMETEEQDGTPNDQRGLNPEVCRILQNLKNHVRFSKIDGCNNVI